MSAGPPFEPYPVSSGEIFASSDAMASKVSGLVAVAANVQSAAKPATSNVFGMLAPPLIAAPRPVVAQTQQLIQQTVFAAGATRVFGQAVDAYDAGIDRLNARWETAVASDFGVAEAVIPAGADQQERQDIEGDRAQAVSAAREQLRRQLRAEQRELEEAVDDSADQVAAMLSRGPNAADLQSIESSGGFDNLPQTVFLSKPGGVARSVLFASAAEFAKAMARTSPGLIGPLRFPGSPLYSYTQPNLSPAQARWQAWAKRIKLGGTAAGFGVTGVNQHLKDLRQYPNMDTEERVGRDGGAILSKALPAVGAGAAAAAATVTAPVWLTAGAAIAVGTGAGLAIDKWGKPITEPIINATGDAADWAWDARQDANEWTYNAADDAVDWAWEARQDTNEWTYNAVDDIGDKLGLW